MFFQWCGLNFVKFELQRRGTIVNLGCMSMSGTFLNISQILVRACYKRSVSEILAVMTIYPTQLEVRSDIDVCRNSKDSQTSINSTVYDQRAFVGEKSYYLQIVTLNIKWQWHVFVFRTFSPIVNAKVLFSPLIEIRSYQVQNHKNGGGGFIDFYLVILIGSC